MSSPELPEIVCAHSPDSDDAFMFYGLATKKIRSKILTLRHVLEDIESLNRKALDGVYGMTAISYHAYPYVADKYVLTAAGSSVGDGYGPILVASRPFGPDEIKGKRIGIPGTLTSAYLTLRLMEPDFEAVPMAFDQILTAVKEQAVDLGLIIHEGQLTYAKAGFYNVVDLGRWWKSKFNLPLPLGANAILRSLPAPVQSECTRLLSESIRYSLDHQEEAINYALQFARDMDLTMAQKFVGMYVNDYTVDCGELLPVAAQKLLDLGYEAGLIPQQVKLEFVR
ncbi:MAG: ABC transporter substrate-binding protein [Bryobacteraceae bacterium]|nr:ABC transporter substrate-binding protein [Bryobacteraceae bacterium]MDW8378937.1 MqnA/MqnD/SBP family protein [Bryobacterales bacterium]